MSWAGKLQYAQSGGTVVCKLDHISVTRMMLWPNAICLLFKGIRSFSLHYLSSCTFYFVQAFRSLETDLFSGLPNLSHHLITYFKQMTVRADILWTNIHSFGKEDCLVDMKFADSLTYNLVTIGWNVSFGWLLVFDGLYYHLRQLLIFDSRSSLLRKYHDNSVDVLI